MGKFLRVKAHSKEFLLRLLWRMTGRRRTVDMLLTPLLQHRKVLPKRDPSDCIPRFNETEIKIRQLPIGQWSTPLTDVLVILKAAIGFQSKRILELGSYRGDTARLLAENTGDDVQIVAVDSDPRHGGSYRDHPLAWKIAKRTGRIGRDLFSLGETFDLIFVDSFHDYDSVWRDTELAVELLDPQGVILWHDYERQTYFDGFIRVPEVLKDFSQRMPIASLETTWLAIHSRHPGWTTAEVLAHSPHSRTGDIWEDRSLRG